MSQSSFEYDFRNAGYVSHDVLLGRWRLSLELFGRIFCDDVGAEPGSIIGELGGFPVKETKFRREMEKLRNSQQKELTLEVRFSIPNKTHQPYHHLTLHFPILTTSATNSTFKLHLQKHSYTNYKKANLIKFPEETEVVFKNAKIPTHRYTANTTLTTHSASKQIPHSER